MRRMNFLSIFGAEPAHDHLHTFETSWLLPPLALAIFRFILSLYIFVTIFFIWIWYGAHGKSDDIGPTFSYFTWLTYWGLGFYFLVASIHTSLYALTGRSVLFDKGPQFLRGLHSLFYTTVTTFPFLVTIVYWVLLFDEEILAVRFTTWSNVSQHGLNSLWALLEIVLPATQPHPLMNLPFLILMLLLYLALAYLTHYTQGFYTYGFLDPGANGEKSGKVAGYCFGILAAILIIFAVSWGLIWIRQRLAGGRIKRSPRDVARSSDASHDLGLEAGAEMKADRI